MFYLESFIDPFQMRKIESKDLNEQAYLVVRSLKYNNQKVVSYFAVFSRDYRTTISNRAILSRSVGLSSPSRK